jgi:hypothetical protein
VKDVKDITVCVADNGLFLPIARRMAEACKRVIWHPVSWQRGFCSVKEACIGLGIDNLEHCLDFWPFLNEIDLFMFPDIGNSGLQLHLESLGKAVWGSRSGDEIERDRELFLLLLGQIGLDVPEFKVVVGVDNLRAFLKDKEDWYIKISQFRRDVETRHWRDWKKDEEWLDWLALTLGPFKETMRFLCFPAIKTPLELGGDGYNVDGRWPSLMLNGFEYKDNTYFAAVTPRGEMPEQIQEIMDAVAPYLASVNYRNQISFEDRALKDMHLWIDATQRGGMPSTASQLKLWKNFPEIAWAGANGELIDPKPAAKFSIEAMIKSKGDCENWDQVDIPPELEPWVNFGGCCKLGGVYRFPPDESHAGDLGWLCAIGDTPRETLDRAKDLADMLPDGLDANIEAMANLIKEIEQAEEEGIPFTKQELPKPVEAIN